MSDFHQSPIQSNIDKLITEIEMLHKYGVPNGIICKIIQQVFNLIDQDKKILKIYKTKIASLISSAK